MNKPAISAVIITLNEERNIARCLQSLQGLVDDVVVIDSFSTDRTEEICREYGVRFFQQEWLGYSQQKNYGHTLAKNDWILSIDADEALSEELRKSMIQLRDKGTIVVGEFARLTNYCGHWVRHGGWYPDTKVRLFDRRKVKWEGMIHEELKGYSPSEVVRLKGDCLHYSYYTVDDHYRQTEKFTTLSANDLFARGKKASWFKLLFSPPVKFITDYFFRLGFLDGATGFRIAWISAGATKMKYRKLKQLWKKNA